MDPSTNHIPTSQCDLVKQASNIALIDFIAIALRQLE